MFVKKLSSGAEGAQKELREKVSRNSDLGVDFLNKLQATFLKLEPLKSGKFLWKSQGLDEVWEFLIGGTACIYSKVEVSGPVTPTI